MQHILCSINWVAFRALTIVKQLWDYLFSNSRSVTIHLVTFLNLLFRDHSFGHCFFKQLILVYLTLVRYTLCAYIVTEVEKYQNHVDELEAEEVEILDKQKGLKAVLYSRFGKSINLEEK